MSQIIVVIQGCLKPTPIAQELYQSYLKGTVPLMKKYKVSIFAVGQGIQNENPFEMGSSEILNYPEQSRLIEHILDSKLVTVDDACSLHPW